MKEESQILLHAQELHRRCLLDGCAVRTSGELPVNEDTCGEADLALEGGVAELVSEDSRRHRCTGLKIKDPGPLPLRRADELPLIYSSVVRTRGNA